MKVEDLVSRPGLWQSLRPDAGIVISSRVRLARNLRDYPFPGASTPDQRGECREVIRQAMSHVACLSGSDSQFLALDGLDQVDREILRERHLISSELAESPDKSGLLIAEDERIAVMVNEEDHLRLQAISPGMSLQAVWQKLEAADTALEGHLGYAFSPKLGYLTACPTNLGTGLRASFMLHLSGLRLLDEIDSVIKGLDCLGIVVRGLLGEGTEAYGNMFQISNQSTLGESEEDIIDRLIGVAEEVVTHEQNARARLVEDKRGFFVDQVCRALGILTHARLLSSNEAVDLLSGMRLGVECGFIEGLTLSEINEIMLLTQPGHLQRLMKCEFSAEERDQTRAEMVRDRLRNVVVRT